MFDELGFKLRAVLQDTALRIDHVGSTAVMGLEAKPVIDIQISVADHMDLSLYKERIESVGFKFREQNPDLTKRYFREVPGSRRTHIHVRQAGSLSEQMTLVFRDYLRAHPDDCLRYAQEKHRLMKAFKHERPKYVDGKGPIVWDIIQKAYVWSQETGWTAGPTDQ